jgi:acyl-coenzyme A thioesterase PaaI-like protein
MSFFRPTQGDRVVAEARLIRAGLNLVFASAEIANASGEVTARCEGTCAVALGKSDGQGIYERMRAGKAAP